MVDRAKRAFWWRRVAIGAFAIAIVFAAAMASTPSALAAESPEWKITSYAMPTNLPPGGNGEVVVTAVNVGGGATDGSTVTVKDQLPTGLVAKKILGYDTYALEGVEFLKFGFAPPADAQLGCEAPPVLTCTYGGTVQPGAQLRVVIEVSVESGAAAIVANQATVAGGGAPEAGVTSSLSVSNATPRFGLDPNGIFMAASSHAAGAHANVTTAFAVNTSAQYTSVGNPKDVAFTLPPGFVGNTTGMPRCTASLVSRLDCPADTIMGVATVVYTAGSPLIPKIEAVPVLNITPSPGEPAAFMFDVSGIPVRLDTSVLSDGNYAVRVQATNLEDTEAVFSTYVTMWGVPGEHQGPGAIEIAKDQRAGVTSVGAPSAELSQTPLLSNATECSSSLGGVAEADFWRAPGAWEAHAASMGTLNGCLGVQFASTFSFLPDTLEAGSPAGYEFDLRVPQVNAAGVAASADVRDVQLTLPQGVVVNPSAAWGLKACSAEAFYGEDHPSQRPAPFGQCPRESKIGTVWVKTPALEEALEGQVYLAEPECRPCTAQDAEEGKMVKLYVEMVSEGEGGIVVKLEGRGMVDQATGRITTVFEENPQLPFDRFKLKLTGGPRAVLANPRTCGTVKAEGDLKPWSSLLAEGELGAVADSKPFYEFEINQNCHGAEFDPSFKAGMPNIQAGENGEFTLAFGRPDNSEMLKSIAVKMPEGLMGSLTGIPLCKEAEANAGTCSEASLLGSAEVLTGPGADPFLVQGGKVYLTEGYGGAQFGLSIVVPAVAGPYTLAGTTGKGTVVVRSQIYVDPHTAQLTVVSGEMPHMLDGIPLQLKAVNVRINRPSFMFNPTSCEKMAIAGTLDAVEGMSANVSSPFQVTNCARLPFTPVFKASTQAHHTRKDGASLHVTVESSHGQANVGYAKVELPRALPSRLSTLQKACTEAQFNANPAGCPAESDVGSVEVNTPVLPVPLTGPAYFVSRGAQWPELIMVLQGYGVTVYLNGETHISKGVTTTTLASVPDVPFTKFSLTLPEKEYSALAANGNLCAKHLVMPIRFIGQSGKTLQQNTKVQVEGCPGEIRILSHRAKGKSATLKVYVPGAGTLKATGKGLKAKTKKPNARGTVTLRLRERRHSASKAQAHKTKLHLAFTPKEGKNRKRQTKTIAIKLKR